jgi:uncharacterized protein with von Willebrand factor type A (vWA) domain
MDLQIAEFAELLRHNGLKVSASEVIDAAQATSLVELDERVSFRAALAATLVKRGADQPIFDRVFDLFFSGAAKTLDELDGSLLKMLTDEGLLEDDQLEMIALTLQRLANGLSPLSQALIAGDRSAVARLFRNAALQLDFSGLAGQFQQGFYARRLLSGSGSGAVQRDLQAIEAELKTRGLSAEGVDTVSRHLAAALRKVEEAARREVDRQVKARVPRLREQAAGARSFSTLTREEMVKAEAGVRRLAERLKSRLVRRERARRRGKLAVRRTLRKNLSWGGIPARLVFRSNRPDRPDIVVLCDVSDSVRNISRVMLLFVHTLQSLFHRVRSFVFVSDVGEVTQLFKDCEVREAIDLAVAGKAISLHANSNYGRALASFARNHLGAVSRKTTVLIIGDGRNNYNPPNVWALDDIKRKARQVIWICPEERYGWGTGDSEMLLYARHCRKVATVQNLDDLEKLADDLVPPR